MLRTYVFLSVLLGAIVLSPFAQGQARPTPPSPPDPSPQPSVGSIAIETFECVEPEIPDTPDLRSADGGQRPLQRIAVWPQRLNADKTRIDFRSEGAGSSLSSIQAASSSSGPPGAQGVQDIAVTQTTTAKAQTMGGMGNIAPKPGTACLDLALHHFQLYGYVLPDMPAVNWPNTECGNKTECVAANRAWIRAHYYTWIAQLMINFIAAEENSDKRAWLWSRPGINAQGNPITEKSSLEYWFGPYNNKRFWAVKDGLDELWDVFKHAKSGSYNIDLRCPDVMGAGNVCFTKKPGAHHIVRGNVDLCDAFFDDRPYYDQARIMAHELLHHLWVDWGDVWVAIQDKHYHGHGSACIGSPDSSAAYGESKIRHLATYLNGYGKSCGHRSRNVRNNDTYAYFILWAGELVYNGSMTQWPHPAEPTPHPPQCVGDENCLCEPEETWPANEPFVPDGDYSPDLYCWDGDGEMTCRATKFGATTEGICKRCDDVRGPGCVCDNGHPCDVGSCYGDDTFNGGTGYCFKEPPPGWACLADCSRLLNDDNAWCYADYPTGEARCMDYLCTEPEAYNCNLEGKVCRYGECVFECQDDAGCAQKGYPGYFHCNQGRCEHGL